MCGALVIDGKVMIAQRNYGSSQGFFEFPGGKVEGNETKEERKSPFDDCSSLPRSKE